MIDLAGWPALVLTAGLATRLRPLSDVRAKAAMPVGGKTIIARILEWLRAAGVRRVVLNLHHRAETITRVVGDGSQWDLEVRYSWEGTVMGSAGGPRRALPLLEANRFLIVNGDTLTDCDLRAVARRHLDTGARVTMAVVAGDVDRYGGVLVGPDSIVKGFARGKRAAAAIPPTALQSGPPGEPGADAARIATTRSSSIDSSAASAEAPTCLHFIGVQAADADAFAAVPDDEPSETVRTLYPRLLADNPGAIAAYASAAEFLDVGTPAGYIDAVARVTEREGRPFDRGLDTRVATSAVVERSVLWDRVAIGEGAHLINCVVSDDVAVPDGARHQNAALVAGPGGLISHAF
jgi:NDP-sugar pyrophosphorylase family protein